MILRLLIIPASLLVLSCTGGRPDIHQNKPVSALASILVPVPADGGNGSLFRMSAPSLLSLNDAGDGVNVSLPAKMKWGKEEEGHCISGLCPPGKKMEMFYQLNKVEQRLKRDPYSFAEVDGGENYIGGTIPLY
ncbi:hypothetical protein [Klebsiella sp. KE9767]|uniref:hypothetical protein n=1 Tax=Klebsiella sp. KE9767 TaxID=3118151 RepID=UPI00374FF26C